MSLQKDITGHLGVSQAIVSHILSGRRKARTELHQRIVRQSIDDMHQCNRARVKLMLEMG